MGIKKSKPTKFGSNVTAEFHKCKSAELYFTHDNKGRIIITYGSYSSESDYYDGVSMLQLKRKVLDESEYSGNLNKAVKKLLKEIDQAMLLEEEFLDGEEIDEDA